MSKHTEGAKDKMLRPNGLPESLIRYDGIYISFPKKKILTLLYVLKYNINWIKFMC